MNIARHLQVTFKQADAKEAINTVIPAMSCGFNVNTIRGDFSLHGDDAAAVMNLVLELAERRTVREVSASNDDAAVVLDVIEGAAHEPVTTYNHAFTLAFQLGGSITKDGEDVTAEQMRDALRKRVNDLMDNDEMLEGVGAPYDTYKEG